LTRKEGITSGKILHQLRERREKVRTIQGIVRITLWYPQRRFSLRQALNIQKPHYLRLETLNFWGSPLHYVICNGQQIWVYYPAGNTLLQGSVNKDHLYRLLGIPLKVSELVDILCGDVPLVNNSHPFSLSLDQKKKLYLLRSTGDEELEIRPRDLLPLRYLRKANLKLARDTQLEVDFNNYRIIDGIPFPFLIQIQFPEIELKIRIRFSSLALNRKLPLKNFQLPPLGDKDLEIIELDQ